MIRWYSSSGMSRNGVGELVPAPLIRMSTLPEGFARSHIDRHEVARAAVGFDFGEAFFRLFRDAPAEHDLRPGACEAYRHGAAEFAGSADHDGGFA